MKKIVGLTVSFAFSWNIHLCLIIEKGMIAVAIPFFVISFYDSTAIKLQKDFGIGCLRRAISIGTSKSIKQETQLTDSLLLESIEQCEREINKLA